MSILHLCSKIDQEAVVVMDLHSLLENYGGKDVLWGMEQQQQELIGEFRQKEVHVYHDNGMIIYQRR